MSSLARKLKETIENNNLSCFSLYAGYGMYNGEYVRFPVGVSEHEKRNEKGRVIYSRYRYADNSVLEYRYDAESEKITLTVKD
jgi:hypothetical protein